MRLNNNISMLRSGNRIARAKFQKTEALTQISTGKRIINSGSDAAGNSVASSFASDRRSVQRAVENINMSLATVATSEGATEEAMDLLIRGRELAVQASNGTYSDEARENMQIEIASIVERLDLLAANTEFNGKKVASKGTEITDLAPTDKDTVVTALLTNWLGNSENLVKTYYGIEGDGSVEMTFNIGNFGGGSTVASVSASLSVNTVTGETTLLETEMTIDLDHSDIFLPTGANQDGGNNATPFNYGDRIIAHEMVHAITNQAVQITDVPGWFKEGTAEMIHGADFRLDTSDGSYDNALDATGLAAALAAVPDTAAPSSSEGYAGSYLVARYMHSQLTEGGHSGGIKSFFEYMAADKTRSFDDAINNFSGDLNGTTNGLDYLNSAKTALSALDLSSGQDSLDTDGDGNDDLNIDLTNDDTGAIGGEDADGGASRDAADVVPNASVEADDFDYQLTEPETKVTTHTFQIGENSSDTFSFGDYMSDLRSDVLGVSSANISSQSDARSAIGLFDDGIITLSTQIARLGAATNALTSNLETVMQRDISLENAQSKIEDADMAESASQSVKQDLLLTSSVSALKATKLSADRVLTLIS